VARGLLGTALTLLAAAYSLQLVVLHRTLDAELRLATSAVAQVEPGSTLLPMVFDRVGSSWCVAVFLHVAGRYGTARDCIDLANYEARTDHFPVALRRESAPRPDLDVGTGNPCDVDLDRHAADVDAILTWGLSPGSTCEGKILAHYAPVARTDRLAVYRRQTPG
jgi:hypothetical protein